MQHTKSTIICRGKYKMITSSKFKQGIDSLNYTWLGHMQQVGKKMGGITPS